jgi:aminoglycoside phosphotransferase (APT) family kinase protein
MTDAPVLTPIRPGHEFDQEALQRFLQSQAPGFDGELQILQFEGGQSNPTFLLKTGSGEYVLRKQPPGELLPSAHQVDREYRVMRALESTDVPVPRMIALENEGTVLGTRFYVMEKVEGRVLTDLQLPDLSPEDRRAVYLDLASVLAKLHQVTPETQGLGDYGRPGNYYTRQISRWSRQYEASKTENIEAMDKLMAWLPEHMPDTDEARIVHGDYRLGNVMLHPTEPRIVAVLDWELSTLGHPLADLGYLCMDYHSPGYDGQGLGAIQDLAAHGIPSEAEMLAHYCKATGRDGIDNWTFYLVYNLFRSAAIIQGVYKRGLDGNAASAQALEYKEVCRSRSELAWSLVEQAH